MSGGADVMPVRTSSPPFSGAPAPDIRVPGTIEGNLNSSRGGVPRAVGASGGGGEAGERAQYMLKQILKQQQQQYEETEVEVSAVGAAERWLSERERRQRERTEKLRESLKRKSQTSTQLNTSTNNNNSLTNSTGITPNSQQVIQQLLLGEKTALSLGGGSLPHQHYSHSTNTAASYNSAAIDNGATNQNTTNSRLNPPQPVSASSTTFPEIVAVERGRTEFFMQQNANIRSGPGGQEQRVEGKLMTSNNSLMSSRSQQPLQKKQSGTQSPPLALQLPPLNGNNAGQLQNQTNNNINGSLANKNSSKANNVARKISNKTTGSTAKVSSNGCEAQTLNSTTAITPLTDKSSGIAVPTKRWSVAASAADTNLLLFNQAVHRQQKQSSATAPGGAPRLNGHSSFELVPVGIPISALHYTSPENNAGSAPDVNNNNVNNNNGSANAGVVTERRVFPEGVGGVTTKKYAINFCHLADAPLNFANHYLQERSKEQLDYRSICGFWLNHLSHYSPDSWMPLHQNSLILLSSGNNNPNNPQYNNHVTNGGFQPGGGESGSEDDEIDERVLRRQVPQQQGQKGNQRQQVAQRKVKAVQNVRQNQQQQQPQQFSSNSSNSEMQQQTKRL